MKKIKKTIVLCMVALLVSCHDFLEVDLPNDQLTADLIFKDDQLAKAAMAGVYRSLEEKGFLSGSSAGGGGYMGCYADELVSYQISTSNLTQLYSTTVNPQSNVVKTLWNDTYNQLYSINRVIAGLTASTGLSADVKAKLMGEAYFLRAFLHFYLTQTFGDIPYVTSVDYVENSKIKKTLSDQILILCLDDLAKAENGLPQQLSPGLRIKPTKMAVYALKARIFLYKKDWDNAIITSSKVIAQGGYTVETDLSKTFLKESKSSIWQLEPIKTGNNTKEGSFYTILSAPPTQVSLTYDFVNSFFPGDQRKQKWIGSKSDVQQNMYYFPSKYKQSSVTATTLENSIVLRVEEVFLIRSEAYLNKLMLSQALSDLNIIRTRTGLAAFSSNIPNEIMHEIIQERRHELFAEFGHRFYDLRRLEMLDDVLPLVKPQWKPFNKNLPLPESELLLNPNLGAQNDGY
ncbi:RagB/SusD family nutrient uptake outer membrane protein [Chryseobacterium taiwanense]|uniref:Starch-binding protein n=1 Tax=Chryseobacterium taiwanense TaxID=363331 RepID=A0A0B4CJC5_9FLAO|nr:RagB/SusD family nutrient uptake outer membrane protein [Chryseobacterium taiwanense]KIC61344.1 hypothetical protein RM51_17860 [Chryseobacterium taiwanense]